jgi:hypothetical protein
MILEFANYLTSADVDDMCKYINEVRDISPDYKHIKSTSNFSNYREGKTLNIGEVPELKNIDDKLQKIFSNISNDIVIPNFKPLFPTGDTGYEYHCYEPGEVCRVHGDGEITNNSKLLRIASVIIHLNTVENGGELVFPMQNKSIKTEKGKLVIFPPYGMYQHYTTTSEEKREVIVTWFVYNSINIVRI